MNNFKFAVLAVATLAAFAAQTPVQAQSLTQPGVSVAGNVNARGTVNGAITQIGGGVLSFSNGTGLGPRSPGASASAFGGQSARVGGVAGVVSANRIDANGTVNGAITQLRVGVAEGGNEQLAAVGSVSNTTANNVRVTGTASGAIVQVGAAVASGLNVQALQIGSVTDVDANNINATGTLIGASTQINAEAIAFGANEQIALIGGARRVDANNLTLNGTLRGNLLQIAGTAGGVLNSQVANVGGVHDTRARNITTNGTVNGAVTQIAVNVGSGNVQSAVVGGVQGAQVSGNEQQ